ncbi:MAG: nucleoside deaminase [Ruminococcaceae bacterium]|nr:nucleoside deaminase [Oscillospiraceae bacterium]
MIKKEFMKRAIELSNKAALEGEVPVGAVIIKGDKIVAEGYNKREQKQNALSHAETEAINAACESLGSWRLDGCEMYVTLEPCPMCTGAIMASRLDRVVFGAYDEKGGAMGSVCDLCELPFPGRPQIVGGFMEKECADVMGSFFAKLR